MGFHDEDADDDSSDDEISFRVPPSETAATLSTARRILYISHLFAQFADGAWQFSLVLFLAAFTNYESLLLVSTYGLISGLTICVFGSTAGQFVDNANRLFAAQRFIWTQNLFVLLATVMSYMLLIRDISEDESLAADGDDGASSSSWFASRLKGVPLDPISVLLLVGVHIFGSAAEVLNRGFLVAMERDWIVVLSKLAGEHEQHQWLSDTNVAMKQIDLSCQICAPAIAGFIIAALKNDDDGEHHGQDLWGAALLVGFLNVVSLIVEYSATAYIYNSVPALAIKNVVEHHHESNSSTISSSHGEQTIKLDDSSEPSRCKAVGRRFCRLPHSLQVYMDQSVSWGGIGFAMLYLNALTFGALMTAYLLFRGMRFSTIGVWRGVASAIGLLGTVVYHFSVKKLSVESTGMWSICYQFASLSLAYASLYFDDYMTSLAMLIAGVCASRIGLWVFDIAITQMMQEYVPAPVRGVTGGVQQSLNAFFGLLAFVLGIMFPDPQDFHIMVSAGYASVGVALVMYTFSIFLRRDKLRSLVPTNDEADDQEEDDV